MILKTDSVKFKIEDSVKEAGLLSIPFLEHSRVQ